MDRTFSTNPSSTRCVCEYVSEYVNVCGCVCETVSVCLSVNFGELVAPLSRDLARVSIFCLSLPTLVFPGE